MTLVESEWGANLKAKPTGVPPSVRTDFCWWYVPDQDSVESRLGPKFGCALGGGQCRW